LEAIEEMDVFWIVMHVGLLLHHSCALSTYNHKPLGLKVFWNYWQFSLMCWMHPNKTKVVYYYKPQTKQPNL
jgi:hypothetical protein